MPDHDANRLFDGKMGVAILETYTTLKNELEQGLSLYFNAASDVLKGTGIQLRNTNDNGFSIEKNFFTAIFLYSYFKAGIIPEHRIVYTAVNQCLRGMVTGCDNILDNEYKKTLDTDLPENSHKFRSIIDIMVSDRAVLAILDKGIGSKLSREKLIKSSFETLRALSLSGVEEAEEEDGQINMMPPDFILSAVHHFKTGLLFVSPWVVPNLLEDLDRNRSKALEQGLYNIGMGCQVLDDMADIAPDLSMNRYNYIASLAFYGENPAEKQLLNRLVKRDMKTLDTSEYLAARFPEATAMAWQKANDLLRKGLEVLFSPDHQFMIDAAIQFLIQRIGVSHLVPAAVPEQAVLAGSNIA